MKGLDWIITILGLYSMYSVGNLEKRGWVYKLVSQIVWIILAIQKELYGFIPLALVAGILAIRNYIKWTKNEKISNQKTNT